MKTWNWGKSIVAAFLLFFVFIFSFLYRVQTQPQYNSELVTDEYYKKDQRYSEEYDARTNAQALSEEPQLKNTASGIEVVFPAALCPVTKGTVSLYRPSDKNLDFTVPLVLSGNALLIPENRLVGGRWDITVEWVSGGKPYFIKEQLYR